MSQAAVLVGEWRRAFAALSSTVPPCTGFRDWPSVHQHALQFLDERGEEAVGLGWTVLDLFGVHHKVGTARADCSGALLGLEGRPIIELTEKLLRHSNGLAFYRRPKNESITLPIWHFKR